MQPQQSLQPGPQPPAGPPQSDPNKDPANQYDFILNPGQARKLPVVASSLTMRIAVVVGGFFILMLIAIVAVKLLGSSGSVNKAAMLSVAQDQTELARLAESGIENAVSQTTKNFAVTVKVSTSTQESQFITYLQTIGIKPKDKTLALKQSVANDTALANAKSASTFDTAYAGIMKQDLMTYQQDLNVAYAGANDPGKVLLKQNFNSAQLLLDQLTTSAN